MTKKRLSHFKREFEREWNSVAYTPEIAICGKSVPWEDIHVDVLTFLSEPYTHSVIYIRCEDCLNHPGTQLALLAEIGEK